MSDPGVQASIHKNLKTTLPRIYNYIKASRFQEVNLLGRLYSDTAPVTLSHWALPGGAGAWQEWTFDEIIKQEFTATSIGEQFGPTWTTHWFKVEYEIPDSWAGQEVRFRWASGSEASVWTADGKLLQGLSTGTGHQMRPDYTLTKSYEGGAGPSVLYIEMAANRLFGAGEEDDIAPPNPNKYYTLTRAEIASVDTQVYKLTRDLEVLHQIAETLIDLNDQRGYQALYTANQMVNNIIAGKDSDAGALADAYFKKANGERVHKLAAIGNCHIDSAWLWPYSETKRKVGRSFSSQIKLMEDYPDYIFVASQAQQWQWCKEYYPELYERIKAKVVEGKFLPVGSAWVEMDGNIPSGESFIRQFLHGQRFYQKELGFMCKEFWLPDTFGYSAQIPALMRHMDLSRFLTQKMSWNLVNKFPHHNFTWEGIDGSTVLAHFPPGDSYTMNLNVDEVVKTETNLQDKGRVGTSAFLFGYGDGGGGPTQDMLERAARIKDSDGCPKFDITSPDVLFTELEKDQHNMCRWVGELFLELHNGTYTSQAAMKKLCRKAEFQFRDAEFLLSAAIGTKGPEAASLLKDSLALLDPSWKKVLLNQFHDVLPGSGIGLIYPEAERYYNEAISAADTVWEASAQTLFGSEEITTPVAFNTLQWPRQEVVTVEALKGKSNAPQHMLIEVPPLGYSLLQDTPPAQPVTVTQEGDLYVLENSFLKAKVDSKGQVVSLLAAGDGRDFFVESVAASSNEGTRHGNQLVIMDDEPVYWDAWDVMDYHLETPKVMNALDSSFEVTDVAVIESGPLVARLRFSLKISEKSKLSQDIVLTAASPYLIFETSVDWYENRKFLKVLFDHNVFTRNASFDIQFGHLERATHMNTSWDSARYEVCGHKWCDVSEPDWGMAVLNDSKYGWMARGHHLTLSLLKSPKAPDDNCDMKTHIFKYGLMPHLGTLVEANVVQRAYEFNNSLRIVNLPKTTTDITPQWSVGSFDGEGIVLHTIKPDEDGSGDVVLRLFECRGARSKATLQLNLPITDVLNCGGMEDASGKAPFTQDSGVTSIPINLTPFAIKAFRLKF
ncbi:alpha-mannosidase 2C1-like [Macrobrachium rosenbergii]|uniref:alpha-mannosidase 2C1-like n=1 Tax=Macrobrachium rosenbergii TaxID=79674 RepID=UPI0034D3D9BA